MIFKLASKNYSIPPSKVGSPKFPLFFFFRLVPEKIREFCGALIKSIGKKCYGFNSSPLFFHFPHKPNRGILSFRHSRLFVLYFSWLMQFGVFNL